MNIWTRFEGKDFFYGEKKLKTIMYVPGM